MPTVFIVLAADHAEVRAMLTELENGPSNATGADQHQLDLRKRMTQTLTIEASRHEAVEEMFFWPAVREQHADGNTLADEAITQEQQARQILAELETLEADDARFEALLGMFTEATRKHIEFEEAQVWPGLHSVLTAETAEELGRKITEGKKTAPSRPHPHTPASPGVLKTTSSAVAAAGMARDAVPGSGYR